LTLAALLTFFSVLIAILSLARPVRRRSLELFVPRWRMSAAISLSLACIICRDAPLGMKPLFGWPLPTVLFGLTLASFIFPVGAALWCWGTWRRAKLTTRNITRLGGIFSAAVRENEFDEVERIVRRNEDRLERLPTPSASLLFSPAIVSALVASRSFLHLDLLAKLPFLSSLENRFEVVDTVVRELLRSSASPLRSAVVSRFGGVERLKYTDADRMLMEKTFENPEWYLATNAHYPLLISAVEELRKGLHDAEYNGSGRDYEASQGISMRSRCPIYLAEKTEFLSIEAAIRKGATGDFYISDLFDIFRFVQDRSKYDETVWKSDRNNREFPTPYSYLLHEIAYDLRGLSSDAVEQSIVQATPQRVTEPGRIAQDLAQNWAICVWNIGDSEGQVGPEFRSCLLEEYLKFVLQLGWEPSEICFGLARDAEGLEAWRDLFLRRLQDVFRVPGKRYAELRKAFDNLDHGKRYVFEGLDWLEKELFTVE
jgi:hypothetical protein